MRAPKYPSTTCPAQFGPCCQRPKEDSWGEVNTPEMVNDKYSDAPEEEFVFVAKGVDSMREKQMLIKEPTVENSAIVYIAQYKVVHLREVVEEHR